MTQIGHTATEQALRDKPAPRGPGESTLTVHHRVPLGQNYKDRQTDNPKGRDKDDTENPRLKGGVKRKDP